jgi:ADP-dependent NAD(P)H-hydrate dehydratase / NAD(P)H-hydrate epimerase
MRQADDESTRVFSIPEILLMEHAALALASALEKRFGALLPSSRGVVIAGPGNNGGDVLAAARVLIEKKCQNLFIVLVGSDKALSPATQTQLSLLSKQGIAWGRVLSPELLSACDWVLDGIVGTGLSRPIEGPLKECIELLNTFSGKKWILSADLPSGLDCNTGLPLGAAVRASATVTFGFYKRGLVTGEAPEFVGSLSLAPIQIPRLISSPEWSTFLYTEEDARRLPHRRKDSHKGLFGHVSIVAGRPDKEGACALAALGALKAGAGLVTIHAPAATLEGLRPRLAAEVQSDSVDALLALADARVVVVGPGMGTENESWELLKQLLKSRHQLVLDADALNLMALHSKEAKALMKERSEKVTILTPHPKEAARLLECTVRDTQVDRYACVKGLAETWNASVVLKGAGTLCTALKAPTIAVMAGDSGLSKGGTGDVLAGILGSLLAQGLSAPHAVPLGVYLHGKASELLTLRNGHARSSLAGEVATCVSDVLRDLECQPS